MSDQDYTYQISDLDTRLQRIEKLLEKVVERLDRQIKLSEQQKEYLDGIRDDTLTISTSVQER